MRLILVRHGETNADSIRRYWGQSDVELSAIGLEQAEMLRRRLSSEKIDAIYTSTLKRASVTADIIASERKLAVTGCNELNEVDFGKIEGLTFEEISQRYPELTKLWASWSLELAFPGGESFDGFNKRVVGFLDRLKKHTVEETVLVVGHGGPFRLLLCHLIGLSLKHWGQFYFDLASVSVLETYNRGAVLCRLNDIAHLE